MDVMTTCNRLMNLTGKTCKSDHTIVEWNEWMYQCNKKHITKNQMADQEWTWIQECNNAWNHMDTWLTKYMANPDDQGMIMPDQMTHNQTIYHASETVYQCYEPMD